MAIETYSDLQDSVADWLNRDDLGSVIPDFIHNAESRLQRRREVRKFVSTTLSVSNEEETLPADFHSLEVLAHDTASHAGGLETASLDELALVNDRRGHEAGAPTHYAVIGREKLRFAPPPDQAYTLRFGYWKTISNLSGSNTDNWLLLDYPDIYLYATLVESAPYLKNDERLPLWERELEARIQELKQSVWDTQWSGPIKANPRNPIP